MSLIILKIKKKLCHLLTFIILIFKKYIFYSYLKNQDQVTLSIRCNINDDVQVKNNKNL